MIRVLEQKMKKANVILVMFDLIISICGQLNLEEEVKKSLDKYNIKWREIE